MNCCNRQLLLPLEDDGLTVDNIILVHTMSNLKFYKVIVDVMFLNIGTIIKEKCIGVIVAYDIK